MTKVTDQGGTLHAYDYDKLGRQTQDRVTNLGGGVDGTVRRIATTCEVRGMRATITSYDNPVVGSGTVLNESQFAYNGFGLLVTDYQAHGGTVNTSTTPKVQYDYADGSNNTIRPTGLVYPNGRELTYEYGSSGSIADRSSRIASIVDDDETHLCDYNYLGRGTFVEQDNTQPQIKWTLIDLDEDDDPDTGDIYSGLDRFGRVKGNRWYNYDSQEDVDRIQYGYDRASNRIWRHNVVATNLSKEFDEIYAYDGVHRLKDMARGALNGGRTALTSTTFAQCWTLDSTGNWQGFREDDNGDGMWDLVQARAANRVNEITDISEAAGPSWVTPAYSAVGNMTTVPRPADPTASYTATYDAWNRLVKVADGADTVSEYAYDGVRRRIIQKSYTGGTLSETRHLYYTQPSQWQVLEERLGTSTDAERQFVWGLRYIDDCVLRDRDTNADGTLDQRLYACQDANWNATAVADNAGGVLERYAYSGYGVPEFLTPSFGSRAASSFDWETLYAGYLWQVTTQLFFVRHRCFHSVLGTWLTRDPLGLVDNLSLYQYCSSRPLSTTDPFGLIDWSQWPTWLPRTTTPEQIEKLLRQEKNAQLAAELRRAKKILNEVKRLAEKTRTKPGGPKGGGGRRGCVKVSLLKYLVVIPCEIACAADLNSCKNGAANRLDACLEGARDPDQISLCQWINTLDLAECGTIYTACGLTCLLPFSIPE